MYAQTRSCAAPCLGRASEDEYRAVARRALDVLTGPRDDDPDLPPWVSARPARAVVVDPVKRGLGVYPVRDGRVLEQAALMCPAEHLEDAMRGLEWPEPDARDEPPDWPWLLSWLHAPKRKGRYLVLEREARAVIT